MPNFNIVVGSQFNPFTYDELVRPIQEQQNLHNQLEEKYADMQAKADVWKNMIDSNIDKKTAAQHKAYMDDLNASVDDLLTGGLNPNSRRRLYEMNRRYASEIAPIENAYNARKAQIAEQLAGRAKGMVYDYDAATTSLDDYISNPSKTYRMADSNIGLNRVSAQVQNYINNLQEVLNGGNIDTYTKAILAKSGYDLNDVNSAVYNAMNDIQGVLSGKASLTGSAGNAIKTIMQNEAKASGISDWESKAAQNDYMNKMIPALQGLAGSTKISTASNPEATARLQNALYNKRHAITKEDFFERMGIEQQEDGTFTWNGEPVSAAEVNKMIADYNIKGKKSTGSSSGNPYDPLSKLVSKYQRLGFEYLGDGNYKKGNTLFTKDEVLNKINESEKKSIEEKAKGYTFGYNQDGSVFNTASHKKLLDQSLINEYEITPNIDANGNIEFKNNNDETVFTINTDDSVISNEEVLKGYGVKNVDESSFLSNSYTINKNIIKSLAKKVREAHNNGIPMNYKINSNGGIRAEYNPLGEIKTGVSAEGLFASMTGMSGAQTPEQGVIDLGDLIPENKK